MASNVYQLTSEWSAANRYTAASATDVILSNVGQSTIYWDTTTDDTAPAQSEGHPLRAKRSQPMSLNSGERLWIHRGGNPSKALLGGV